MTKMMTSKKSYTKDKNKDEDEEDQETLELENIEISLGLLFLQFLVHLESLCKGVAQLLKSVPYNKLIMEYGVEIKLKLSGMKGSYSTKELADLDNSQKCCNIM